MIKYDLITPPSETVVSLVQLKAHLRITHPDDDGYLVSLIEVATTDIVQELGGDVALITQTWKATFDTEKPTDWVVPYKPLQSQSDVVVTDGVESVNFVVGYGARADVPAPIRHAILMMAAHLFMNREPTDNRQRHEIPRTIQSLIGKYRTQYV